MLLAILSDHLIHAWEAQLLIGLYVIYVATVVFASWWERRQEKRRRTEAVVRSEFEPEGTRTPSEFEEPYRDVREYHYWVCVFRRGLISPKPVLHHHLIRLLRHHRKEFEQYLVQAHSDLE